MGCAEFITTVKGVYECLKPICSCAYPYLEPKLKSISICICRLEEEIKALSRECPEISDVQKLYLQAVLKFLDNKKENEDNLKRVTNNALPMLALHYDVVDVQDKWNNLMKKNDKSSEKVCCLMLSFDCNRLRTLGKIACDVVSLKGTLQKFTKEIREIKEDLKETFVKIIRPSTSSYGLPKSVYGRCKEKDDLISKLDIKEENENGISRAHKTISILGMGGVGKTTLVQFVLSDVTIQNFFKVLWVFAPYKFDLETILRDIFQQLKLENVPAHGCTKQVLLNFLVESVENKSLLLVLDDVWSVDQKDWNDFKGAFQKSNPSSRILVTTQIRNVIEEIDDVIHLEFLSENDCWEFVRPLASEANGNINGLLDKKLSEKFLSKCGGLPLVARTLKFRLQSENKKESWSQDFQRDLDDDLEILFGPFFLNYYALSPRQRCCFSYCSVFPRKYQIDIDDLLELWMSQDYFSAESSETPENVVAESSETPEKEGRKCFETLAKRCLFQEFKKDYNEDIIMCTMHGLVYEFAQFLSKHEKARHFMLSPEKSLENIGSMEEIKKLRTLFVDVRSEASSPLSCDLLVELQCLRTLHLGHCNIEQLPENLDKLVHLRYLNLSGNHLMTTLPNALCSLFELQTLRLKGCTQLQRLPEGIGNLASKFRHLHIEGCNSLKALPKEIGRLTNLRTLDMFIVPSPDNPQVYEALKLEDLSRLEHIQGSIHICQCRNLKNANGLIQTGNLVVLNRVRNYVLNFDGSNNNVGIGDEGAILDNTARIGDEGAILDNNAGIREEGATRDDNAGIGDEGAIRDDNAGIGEGGGILDNNARIREEGGTHDDNEGIGEEGATRDDNAGIRDEGAILDALQPHSGLISLEIRGFIGTSFPKWVDSLTILKRLVFSGCRNWMSLPPLVILQSLESLHIDSMDKVVKVDLQFLGVASNDTVAFPKLKELHFSCLTSWKTWEFGTTSSEKEEHDSKIMPDLASLQISGCDSLEELPGFLRGTRKLLNLTIDKCGTLNPRCQKGVGADWYKISHIQNIKIDGVTIKSPSLAEFQASTSGSSAVPSPGLTNGASTSMDSSNIRWSVAAMQASTSSSSARTNSGSSAVSNPGSTAGPSTVVNSSNKC